jgi:hypothetical protein
VSIFRAKASEQLTPADVRLVIEKGVAAHRLDNMTQRAFERMDHVTNHEVRWKKARDKSENTLKKDPQIKAEVTLLDDDRVQKILDWIEQERCPSCAHESFLTKTLVHMSAGVCALLAAYGILFVVTLYIGAHAHDVAVRKVSGAARDVISMTLPESIEQPPTSTHSH